MGSQGNYEVVRKLASGGMAEIFLARTIGPEGFEKIVVLKKILPERADSPKFVRLFLDEAKLAATLDHPHIAQVYELGKTDGDYYFTMEFVHGQDVRTILKRTARLGQQVPIEHAVHVARDVAAALHYAHERRQPDGALVGIVHRDVSPSNILISYDGVVKLVDFGVAKAATSSTKTRTGSLKGKIAYMSPEQAQGWPIDRRCDIFSLGIVLWELITTTRLFKGGNDLATLQKIIHEPAPPPSQRRPDCSPGLDRIVLRALARDTAERYQTAEELQLDLEELAREQRLNQSSVALRATMHALFHDELDAWRVAQSEGQTLVDHVAGAAPAGIGDSDEDEDGDDADDEPAPAIHAEPTRLLRGSSSRTPTPMPVAGAAKRRWIRWAAAAAIAVIAVVVVTVTRSGSDDDPVPAPAPAVVQPLPAATTRATTTIEPPPTAPVGVSSPPKAPTPKPPPHRTTPAPRPAPTTPAPAAPPKAPVAAPARQPELPPP